MFCFGMCRCWNGESEEAEVRRERGYQKVGTWYLHYNASSNRRCGRGNWTSCQRKIKCSLGVLFYTGGAYAGCRRRQRMRRESMWAVGARERNIFKCFKRKQQAAAARQRRRGLALGEAHGVHSERPCIAALNILDVSGRYLAAHDCMKEHYLRAGDCFATLSSWERWLPALRPALPR